MSTLRLLRVQNNKGICLIKTNNNDQETLANKEKPKRIPEIIYYHLGLRENFK